MQLHNLIVAHSFNAQIQTNFTLCSHSFCVRKTEMRFEGAQQFKKKKMIYVSDE